MVLKNIRTLFKTTPFLYIFLLLSQTAGIIVIMFAYSVYMNNQYSLDASRVDGQKFEVKILNSGEEGELAGELKAAFPEILNGYDEILDRCEVVVANAVKTEDEQGYNPDISMIFAVKDGKYAIADDLPSKYVEGKIFSEEDINSDKAICIVSLEVYQEYGDTLTIGDDTYTVVGREKEGVDDLNSSMCFGLEEIRIPLEAFPSSINEVGIKIYFNRVLTSREYKDLGERFDTAFGYIGEMTEGYEVKIDTDKSLKTMMLAVVFMGLVSAYSSIKFYGYILEKRRKTTAIYLVCGATKGAAGRLYMLEVLLLQAITTVLGILIYMKLVLPNIYEKYKYLALIFEDNNDCYKLVLIYSVLVLAVSFVAIVVNVWRTPIQTLKGNYKK